MGGSGVIEEGGVSECTSVSVIASTREVFRRRGHEGGHGGCRGGVCGVGHGCWRPWERSTVGEGYPPASHTHWGRIPTC